jgi:hypothetical protein
MDRRVGQTKHFRSIVEAQVTSTEDPGPVDLEEEAATGLVDELLLHHLNTAESVTFSFGVEHIALLHGMQN